MIFYFKISETERSFKRWYF